MPVTSLIHVAARRTTPAAGFGMGPTRPTAQTLLDTIGIYIPTDISTMYIPVAAGLAAAETSNGARRNVAVLVALLAAFVTWVLAHRAAQKAARAAGQALPNANLTFWRGWYEIVMAGLAFFIWAWSMPGSWHNFGDNQWWLPGLVVGVATIVIGGFASLTNRDDGG
jgi:hypothetical protein